MAIQRSEQDLLQRLESLHMRGGKHAFVQDLADIRMSTIDTAHYALTRSIKHEARGLRMDMKHPKVLAARQHIVFEYRRCRRSIRPVVAHEGHALRT